MARLPVHTVQPVRGTDPKVMPAVGIDVIDGIVAKAVLARLMDEMRKNAGIGIQPVQTAVIRADPEYPVAVREQRMKTVAPRAIGIGRYMLVVVESTGLRIELAQTVSIRGDPDGPITV